MGGNIRTYKVDVIVSPLFDQFELRSHFRWLEFTQTSCLVFLHHKNDDQHDQDDDDDEVDDDDDDDGNNDDDYYYYHYILELMTMMTRTIRIMTVIRIHRRKQHI